MATEATARPGRPLGIEDLIPAILMRPFVVVMRDEVCDGLLKVALSLNLPEYAGTTRRSTCVRPLAGHPLARPAEDRVRV